MPMSSVITTKTIRCSGYHRLAVCGGRTAGTLIKKVLIGVFDENNNDLLSGHLLQCVLNNSLVLVQIANKESASIPLVAFESQCGWFVMPLLRQSLLAPPGEAVVVELLLFDGQYSENFIVRTCLLTDDAPSLILTDAAHKQDDWQHASSSEICSYHNGQLIETQGKTGLFDVPEVKPQRVVYCQNDEDYIS